jgi:hypothetical protein
MWAFLKWVTGHRKFTYFYNNTIILFATCIGVRRLAFQWVITIHLGLILTKLLGIGCLKNNTEFKSAIN